jgi:hypothetical protein
MIKNLAIKEDVFQRFWDVRLLGVKTLNTVDCQPINILNYGEWNRLQGPDFSGVLLEIGSVKWSGDVEFHWCTSDWKKHQHHDDEKYNKVILHVVWEHDCEIANQLGEKVPILKLSDYFNKKDLYKLQNKLSGLVSPKAHFERLKCAEFKSILPEGVWSETVKRQWKNVVRKRLLLKTLEIKQLSEEYRNDWEKLAFVYIGKYWVDNQNRSSVESLLKCIPTTFIKRSPLKELLAFAWVLGDFPHRGAEIVESTAFETQMEFVKSKFEIQSLGISWYYGKIRPAGWVQNRVLQYLVWLHSLDGQISELLINPDYLKLNHVLLDSPHFNYLGSKFALNMDHATKVMVNAIIPLQLAYQKHREINDDFLDQILELLKKMPPEDNRVTREYSSFFAQPENAYESQALIHQVNEFCNKRKCSSCEIGRLVCGTVN